MHESKSFSSAKLGVVQFVWIGLGKACQAATKLRHASEKQSVWQSEVHCNFPPPLRVCVHMCEAYTFCGIRSRKLYMFVLCVNV